MLFSATNCSSPKLTPTKTPLLSIKKSGIRSIKSKTVLSIPGIFDKKTINISFEP